ncbi:unnamed protein product [Arabis nemorensis]|uniref:Coenzyme Q-binding protein COQ10 START domain-containing protein n=1 Tax=Arabis nemorensis TaxID=586526 RepID=A0A565BEM1_9BRAS|nr:unnamed protein product [Arabis nemorensis]
MEANLDSVWNVLTDYEKLSDFIPGLVINELVEKEGNRVRLFQMRGLIGTTPLSLTGLIEPMFELEGLFLKG